MKIIEQGYFLEVEGLLATQNKHVLSLLDSMTLRHKTIFEIGTCRGGFALLLRNKFPKNKIYTIDKKEWDPVHLKRDLFAKHQITYLINDCFSEPIRELIAATKNKIIFCDGANKAQEFDIFSEYLKPWDIICLHDYFHDGVKTDCWTTCESWYDQIQHIVEKHGLARIKETYWQSVWGCFVKLNKQ